MGTLTIKVDFKEEGGTASVGIIPTDIPEWEPEETSELNEELPPGDYLITWVTLMQGGGSISVLVDDVEKCSQELEVGDDGGNCTITIP